MLACRDFVEFLDAGAAGIRFYTGVPDSLLKNLCAYLTSTLPPSRHIIAANEGNAVALAAGHYLATSEPAVVYMQNSGEGNTVNPLASLADPDVYSIPMLLLVGWRGEPGVHDEPQHVKQGKITASLLETLGIPHVVLEPDFDAAKAQLRPLLKTMLRESRPVAAIIRKGTFASEAAPERAAPPFAVLSREGVIQRIVSVLPEGTPVVSTTGHISRELFEVRKRREEEGAPDFLTVGSMGHASQIALGIALETSPRPVVCLDGDGAALMHLGGWAIAGQSGAAHLVHILLNNGAHGSVGGQPTVGFQVDFPAIAKACGYASAVRVVSEEDIEPALRAALDAGATADAPAFIEIPVGIAARADLGRPTSTPIQNKTALMTRLETDGGEVARTRLREVRTVQRRFLDEP